MRPAVALLLSMTLTVTGLKATTAQTPAPHTPPCPTVPAQADLPAGWSLVDGLTASGLAAATIYGWTGQAYVDVSPDRASAEGGYWVLLATPATVPIPGTFCPDFGYTVQLAANTWTLVGNPSPFPLHAAGADELWDYDPATGYRRMDTIDPHHGAWILSYRGAAVQLLATVTTPGTDLSTRIQLDRWLYIRDTPLVSGLTVREQSQ